MNPKIKHYSLLLLVLSSLSACLFSQSNSGWTQFRGSENDMVATGSGYPTEWNDNLNVLWSSDLTGAGWSSPIVVGDRIFITSAFLEKAAPGKSPEAQPAPPPPPAAGGQQGLPPPGQQQGPRPQQPEDDSYKKEVYRWELTCFDLKSGKELWKQVVRTGNPRINKHVGSTYACETPVSDGKKVFAYFGMTGIYCYDLDGTLLWEKDPGAFKTLNGWGTGSSPVVYKNLLIIQVDNEENSFIMALDAATGTEKWKVSRDEKTTYATPVIWRNKVRTELVTTGKTARSYDLATGNLIWQLKMGGEMSVPSPVYDEDHIYMGNSGGPGKKGIIYSVKAGAEGNITPADSGAVSSGVEWTAKDAGISNPTPLLYKGLLYLLGGRGGEIMCLDAATGSQVYNEKAEKVGACWASPWATEDKIYFFDEKGVTQVIQAGKEFKVLSQNTLTDKFWASVAITNDAYVFRGVKKLYCVKK
jgi:outer membrane protein assembly factor BamB